MSVDVGGRRRAPAAAAARCEILLTVSFRRRPLPPPHGGDFLSLSPSHWTSRRDDDGPVHATTGTFHDLPRTSHDRETSSCRSRAAAVEYVLAGTSPADRRRLYLRVRVLAVRRVLFESGYLRRRRVRVLSETHRAANHRTTRHTLHPLHDGLV